jgi:GDPmannose 4,6-dehydratase
MKKRVLITGVNGQDGLFLAERLVRDGHQLFGIDVQKSGPTLSGLEYVQGSIADAGFLTDLILRTEPDEIYNLASVSQVSTSFKLPEETFAVNLLPVVRMLELIRDRFKTTKLLQATSSEIFGDGAGRPFNEDSVTNPLSPYAVSKEAAYHLVKLYRKAYNIFVVTAILFNHTSHLHSSGFVVAKIIKELVEVKLGKRQKIKLGNLDVYRDWGNAEDYVKAMVQIMGHSRPADFVVGSGKKLSLREITDHVLDKLGLKFDEVVEIDRELFRLNDPKVIWSDPSKIMRELNWRSEKPFEAVLDRMIEIAMGRQNEK